MNNDKMTQLIRKASRETYGTEDNIIEYKCMAGEDFAEFTHRVPSTLYFIGTGNPEKQTHYPHHHPMFNIDEETLPYGVEMHIRSVLNFFCD
jgi:amidohydrolase